MDLKLITTFVPIVLMFGLMYLLLILPEKKRTKKYNEMMSSLKVNDEVLTRGGIMGRIVTCEETYFVIETSTARTKLKISKNGIASKINKDVE
ncbi:preprotein translocase subunit YajC [Clostridium gasigenes]|uniref:Protein translocase subunit yajC n=1 Tax=Clostridium gasigenes TaxID=94869 RepID=A0A1H0UDV2_9CLOT|nr:preprotein translocase subunit YajC [Clostridium gasigenes]MBB6621929.1 preprotein translocase subunit YajC [Clostridium gasigenes]MBU3089779.1 preprotein translocase subunit YajC [Clostridium gasigenes]MBU3102759.1 preprotein translocase subunit YajC [Clostridium gasigenes]MBU3131372.1 preprotein translocase subunit YajC [Clostridium gasigenes]MBU3134875.1 preprotein translocase subunit YajC [Clostridium gasigenes]